MGLDQHNEDIRMDKIFAKLDAEERGDTQDSPQPEPSPVEPNSETPAQEAEATAPDDTPASDQPSAAAAPAEVIEPPTTWKAELKDRWKKLPVDLQRDLAQWETERNSGFNQRLEKATASEREAQKAREDFSTRERALAQEQQRYVQTLDSIIQQVDTLDPIISAYRSTDLVKLARENPGDYAQLDAAYRQRMAALDQVKRERDRVQREALQTHYAREERALLEKIPEFSDAKIGQETLTNLRKLATESYGFRPDEVQTIPDHRHVLVLRDASRARALEAENATLKQKLADHEKATKDALAKKQVAPAPQRVIKPGVAPEPESADTERNKALMKQVRGARSLRDKAEIIARIA